ncbi:hypothetical protein ACFL55_00300 [Candidatus Latescibacterota bacterium]
MILRSTLWLFLLTVVATVNGATPPYSMDDITGVWRRIDLSYEFTSSVSMREVMTGSSAAHSVTYQYELVPLSSRTLIRYGKDLADTASCRYLMVNEVTDSTGTFARGTPFIRSEGETGLMGTWVYADGLTIITWRFDHESVEYTDQVFDLATGAFAVAEHHTGTFTKGRQDDAGRFFITFDNGADAVLFPLLTDDIMYLFDLTARRSGFIRVDTRPVLEDSPSTLAGTHENLN